MIRIYSDLTTNSIFFEGSTVSPKPVGEVEAVAHPTQSDRVIIRSTTKFKKGSDTEYRVFFRRMKITRLQNEAGQTLTAAPLNMDRDEVLSYLNETFTKPKVVEYFEYNPVTDRLKATKAIETTLSSLYLGGQHRISSGAANVYFDDLTTGISHFPVMGGLEDQSLASNQQAGAGFNAPKARIFGDFGSVPLGGSPVNDTAIPYDGDNFFSFNISGVGITTRVAEEVPADQQLKYELSVDGTPVYIQYLQHSGLSVNEDLTWYFTHPLDIEAGSTNHASIRKVATINNQEVDQGLLLVCEGDDVATRYQTNVLHRLFDDKDVAFKEDVNTLLSGSVYKGAYNAATDTPSLPTGSDTLGDFYRVTAAGSGYATGDILVWNGTSYDHVAEESATQQDILTSALRVYDIYVKSGYVGAVSDGSILYPFADVATAVNSASDGDTIYLEGVFNIPTEVVLPADKSLYFYGSDDACVQYTTYDAANGNVFSYDGDGTKELKFVNIEFKNAGGYGLLLKKTAKTTVEDCVFKNNGWDGTLLNTVLSEAVTTLLGYDSTSADLQAFYAGPSASNGGAMRIEEATQLLVVGNTATQNLRGIRVQDCGVGGAGVISRNQSTQNIESGIYLAAGATHGGCQNVTVMMNVSAYNANNGLLLIGGINNKFSQNEVNGNWNAGWCSWGSANATLRDCGLYDNNRSQFNGIGNTGDAKSSIQINEAYNLDGTTISLNPAAGFIAEVLDTQVHYTGLGSNTDKIGLLVTSDVGALPANEYNLINIDDVGFIGQDCAMDFSEVDVTNLQVSLGDCRYQNIAEYAVKPPLAGNYSELPFSNHVTSVTELDVVVDTLRQSIALTEGVGGNVINTYAINQLQSVIVGNAVDIIQKGSDKIQLRGLTLGNVYVNGTVAGSNLSTLNNSLNAAFSMDLTEYREFIETEVGVSGAEETVTFFYIESPDGTYHYPLFKTEAEANAVDLELGGSGSGSSHTHTYVDDPTNTTWYMPNTSNHMSDSSAPVNGTYTAPNGEMVYSVVWNIQTTEDDANYLPTFTDITYNVQEGTAVNIQYKAAGMTESFNLTGVPAGYADTGTAIIGTAEDITNGYGQSVTHTINVTKANAFGSVQGTITINVLANLAGNEFTIVEQETGGTATGIRFTQDNNVTTLDFNTVTFAAGSTYKFYLDGTTVEAGDTLMITDGNGQAYTTGVTLNGTVPNSGTYLEFAIPADVPPGLNLTWTSGSDVINVPMTISGSTYTASVTGITLEGPAANQTGTVLVNGTQKHGWISLNEQQGAGERLVLDNAFFTDLLADLPDYYEFAIGLKGDNWANTLKTSGSNFAVSGIFKGDAYLSVLRTTSNNVYIKAYANGSSSNQMLVNTSTLHATVCAFIDVTSTGNNIRIGFGRNGNSGVTAGDESTVTYSNWSSYKVQTGDQGYGISNLDVMVQLYNTWTGSNFDGADVDWTGLSEISIPQPAATMTTPWTKALDFSGSSERAQLVSTSSVYNPMMMADKSVTVATRDHVDSRPWAATCVFKIDGNSSNQHIWNLGEGAGSTDDNIYLRVDAFGALYFGWGRQGALNEHLIATNLGTAAWYGCYIGHSGVRFSGADATASNLAAQFQIKLMFYTGGSWNFNPNPQGAGAGVWSTTGGRMDRQIGGQFTVGGRGGNRNFHGKVASMLVTTLKRDANPFPSNEEIKVMVTDPLRWVQEYKEGGTFRQSYNSANTTWDTASASQKIAGTQIWLMGDGTSDAYAKIRNQVYPSDQNYTPLDMISMVSSDIQTVSIPGLT